MTSIETARSLSNNPLVEGGWGGFSRELQRLLSLIGYGSTGGVCGAELNGGGKFSLLEDNTCSVYLVLWLCGFFYLWIACVYLCTDCVCLSALNFMFICNALHLCVYMCTKTLCMCTIALCFSVNYNFVSVHYGFVFFLWNITLCFSVNYNCVYLWTVVILFLCEL